MPKRVQIRKSGGDDRYSWALFVDGRRTYTGMSKTEAEYEQFQARMRLCPEELTPTQKERGRFS